MLCRCCKQAFIREPLLSYQNMPKSAQFFPNENTARDEHGVDLLLYQCPYCGMIQLAGNPVPYFRDVIRATGISAAMTDFRRHQFSKWVEENQLQGKKVIEVGCGGGEYMDIMEETGACVYGMEHSAELAAQSANAGHCVYKGFIENVEYPIQNAPYDAFYILNFLEHIPDPGIFLRGIANNLAEHAVGLVEVPNVDMILRESLYSELIQDHLSYFTADTLTQLLSMSGFEVISCQSIWHDYILSAQVRKRQYLNIGSFLHKQQETQLAVDNFLQRMEENGLKTAVWGAGHQALANLSLLHMAGRIACVIDSAPFKQNKLTPATHVSVVSPAVLKDGTIGAVLIMAAGYSDEIRDFLHKNYPKIYWGILRQGRIDERVT